MRPFEDYARIDELSTVEHITADYPPTLITVGDADPFESQSVELISVLEANGVTVVPILFTGTNANLGHDYPLQLDTPAAQQTLATVLTFLETHSQPDSS